LVSFDDVEAALMQGSFDPATWHTARNQVYNSVVQHLSSLTAQNSAPTVLLLDDNMYYRSMRFSYYQLARKYNTGFLEIFLKVPLEVALQRNSARQQQVSENVITKMAARFEEPNPSKYSWESNCLIIDNCNFDHFDLKLFLELGQNQLPSMIDVLQKEPSKQQDREQNLKNLAHMVDISTRKIVAKSISSIAKTTKKDVLVNVGNSLSALRLQFLKEQVPNLSGSFDEIVSLGSELFSDICNDVILRTLSTTNQVKESHTT